MMKWIKDNKIFFAVIILLIVAGAYIGMLSFTKNEADQNTTIATPTQVNNINGSEGFSVNGNVTNVITTTSGEGNAVSVQNGNSDKPDVQQETLSGTNYVPEGGN